MKKIRIGFLAGIGVLAISFTIIAREGMPKKSTLSPKGLFCVEGLDSIILDYYGTPITLVKGARTSWDCQPPPILGDCVTDPYLEYDKRKQYPCPGAEFYFCCAEIEPDFSCEIGYRITYISCYNGF